MLYLGDTPMEQAAGGRHSSPSVGETAAPATEEPFRVYRTSVRRPVHQSTMLWNEDVVIPVQSTHQVLSITIKDKHKFYSASVGSCTIRLHQLHLNQVLDHEYPLFRGTQDVGLLRLQLCITPRGLGQQTAWITPAHRVDRVHRTPWHGVLGSPTVPKASEPNRALTQVALDLMQERHTISGSTISREIETQSAGTTMTPRVTDMLSGGIPVITMAQKGVTL